MILNHLIRLNDLLGTAAIWVSGLLLMYVVGHVSIEIIARSFFDFSTHSMDEFVGYAVGAMTFLALANTFRARKHVRVSILQSFIRGRLATFAEVICIVLTFAITAFLARYVFRTLARNWNRGTVSPTLTETPVWIIDSVIFIGLVLFLLQLVTSLFLVVRDGVPDPKPAEG